MTLNSFGCLELSKENTSSFALYSSQDWIHFNHRCRSPTLPHRLDKHWSCSVRKARTIACYSVSAAGQKGFISSLKKAHPHVTVADFYLGVVAAAQNNPKEAEEHYLGSIRISEATLGNTHPNYIRSVLSLLKIYAQLGFADGQCEKWLLVIN